MKILRNEKGFTLLELLVAITILGAIAGVMSMSVITVMKVTPRSNNWAIALRQVQNAGYWISRDVQTSQNITVGTGSTFLTLIVPQDPNPANDKTVVYRFENVSGEQWLTRTETPGGTIMIAEYISNNTTVTATDNRTLAFTIEATSGGTTVTRQYKAAQRVPP